MYVFHWLQKSSMHKHEKQPDSRAELHGRKGKHYVVEMTSGLESSDKASVKNCQRLFSFLLACLLY